MPPTKVPTPTQVARMERLIIHRFALRPATRKSSTPRILLDRTAPRTMRPAMYRSTRDQRSISVVTGVIFGYPPSAIETRKSHATPSSCRTRNARIGFRRGGRSLVQGFHQFFGV